MNKKLKLFVSIGSFNITIKFTMDDHIIDDDFPIPTMKRQYHINPQVIELLRMVDTTHISQIQRDLLMDILIDIFTEMLEEKTSNISLYLLQ